MDPNDVDALILENRNKIWEDKVKLRNHSRSKSVTSVSPRSESSLSSDGDDLRLDVRGGWGTSDGFSTSLAKDGQQHERPPAGIPSARNDDLSQRSREQQILDFATKRIEAKTGGNFACSEPAPERKMMATVRIGEYSPLNPALLSPGKSRLGLGEYEEKRRVLMNRKKQEYREYLAQARLSSKDQEGRTSLTGHINTKQLLEENVTQRSTVSLHRTGPESRETTFIQDGMEPTQRHQNDAASNTASYMDVSTNTTLTQRKNVPSIRPTFAHSGTNAVVQQQKPLGDVQQAEHETFLENVTRSMPAETNGQHATRNAAGERAGGDNELFEIWNQNNLAKNQSFKYMSPRERKMADLQVSGLPNLSLPSLSFHHPSEESDTQVRTQRDVYKDELRKQIEEKRRLDAEQQERERREDEAIARRVERQQERMQRDYLREQEQNKRRLEQRSGAVEDFRQSQAATKESERPHNADGNAGSEPWHRQSIDGYPHANSRLRLVDDGPRLSNNGLIPTYGAPRRARDEPILIGDGSRLRNGVLIRASDGPRETYTQSVHSFDPEDDLSPELGRIGFQKNVVLDDSLPIPVFRAVSPVIPAVRTTSEMGHCPLIRGSHAIQSLEAKWQVPAVQKNNIMPSTRRFFPEDASNSRQAILTQLGAFRRHLQMEQMKLEDKLRKRNEEKSVI